MRIAGGVNFITNCSKKLHKYLYSEVAFAGCYIKVHINQVQLESGRFPIRETTVLDLDKV
ncbi:MAG: hypothetical protein OHK0047_44150 [Leptolyngbyaceae cyanobacterium]